MVQYSVSGGRMLLQAGDCDGLESVDFVDIITVTCTCTWRCIIILYGPCNSTKGTSGLTSYKRPEWLH